MKKALFTLLVLGLMISASGCFRHLIENGRGGSVVKYDAMQVHFLWGLATTARVDVDRICPSENFTVRVETTFVDGLLNIITSGIFTPTHITVMCESGRSEQIELSPEQMRAVAEKPELIEAIIQGA